MDIKCCAFCGAEIEKTYYMVGDNYLQIKYFDDDDDCNIFCSTNCLLRSLSVMEVDEEDEPYQI